jgi:hypothetical protein
MASSWLLRRVTLVRTDVSEELSASFNRVTIIGELETTLGITNNKTNVAKKYQLSSLGISSQRLLVTASFLFHIFLSP